MAAILRKLFGLKKKKKSLPRKDSVTGRNKTFNVPYLSRLEGNALQPGQSLIVRGTIIGREEFLINFTSGPRVELDEETEELDNRLLSVRVDVAAKRVYLNACIDGEWGREGVVKHKWVAGDDFDIRVRCHRECYDVFIDYTLVATFAHYRPLSTVSHLYINGDIQLASVSWEGKYYALAYSAEIPENLYPGRRLHVSGTFKVDDELKAKPTSFFIDLLSGPDTALHFEPLLARKKVVRRSCINGEWSADQISSEAGFPFKKTASNLFDVVIACNENNFTFYVNDVLLGVFNHVVSPRSIDKIVVSGDLVLHGVHLK
ncbi:hypothetical protein PFISCL1PPCAC_20792 [Pristionchus fissidentatus]|uniref:Galectin n=1 Tax=Pristionchus fissidentatus TaxID=1538716 RepID=A0AAV5WCR4_9BILA|nr:hypothetical protein PFISCL1PPCAC_20792 [Pristionchus fissidentatus]